MISYVKKYYSLIIIVFLIVGYLWVATKANIDLSIGRYALFMDERITFDGVSNILNASNIKEFIVSVIHGGDHRYGRILWNSIALFAVIPTEYFGEVGQIISARILQEFLIISSYLVLTFSLIKERFLQVVFFFLLIGLPYTDYYTTLPKPEPLQLLLISIFISIYFRQNTKLGGWCWIFLGAAFGAKISTLPVVVIFIAASLWFDKKSNNEVFINNYIKTIFYIIVGLCISEPILIGNFIFSIIFYKLIIKNLNIKNGIIIFNIALMIILIINMVISKGASLYFQKNNPLNIWINDTFLNTKHGADDSNIGLNNWILYYLQDWFIAPGWLMLFLGVFFITLLIIIYSINKLYFLRINPGILLIMAGTALNLSVFIGVHRLWGMYLYIGTILILAGILKITDQAVEMFNKYNFYKLYLYLFIGFLVMIGFFYFIPNQYEKYSVLANRTNDRDFKINLKSYDDTVIFLKNYSLTMGRTINVKYDPWLFLPESNKSYLISEFWGPFIDFESRPDVIVMSIKPNNQIDLQGHFSKKSVRCVDPPCYEISKVLSNGSTILTLNDQ